ncbi:unnamed protein product [Effrenium voratum]|nr:unnamed protein product [Effrenium voratum]
MESKPFRAQLDLIHASTSSMPSMDFHRPENGNAILARAVLLQCRLVGNEFDETLQRDFRWAKSEALRYVSPDVVNGVCKLAELIFQKVSLERHADRKQPLVFLYNCTLGLPLYHSRRLDQEAKEFHGSVLKPLLGDDDIAQAVWQVCSRSAWLEQNTRDWDGAAMARDASVVAENVPRMGFDFYR